MRTRFLIAGLAVATCVVTASTALAIDLGDAGGVSYRLQESDAAAGHTADSRADCPRGKSPAGGGYMLFSDMGMNQYEVATSKPFDDGDKGHSPDDGWEVRGRRNDSETTAASYAMCTAGKHRYVSHAEPAEDLTRVKAKCPGSRWHVTGGGGTLGKPASSILIASFPIDGGDRDAKPDDGWETWAYAPADDRLRAFAVCAHRKPAYHSTTKSLDPGFGSRISASCGSGQHLLGVGGQAGDAPARSAIVQLATPDDLNHDQAFDEAGAIFAENDLAAPTPVDSTAFAICTR